MTEATTKVRKVSLHDFGRHDGEALCEIISEALEEKGISVGSFSYSIEVEYAQEETDESTQECILHLNLVH